MQVTEAEASGLKRAFQVVVPAADLAGKQDARIAELAKTLRLPGFRPGKVPLAIVRQRYGKAVLGEVLEGTVGEVAQQVVTDRGLRPAQRPEIKDFKFEDGQDLAFTVALEVLPEITLPDLKAISIEKLTADPDDAAVSRALDQLASRNRSVVAADPRPAEKGDIVVVDFEGRIDGVPFDGGKADDAEIELGQGRFIPGFEDQLVGIEPGQTRAIAVTFPADYGAKDLAGKAAEFSVAAKALKRPVLPAIDDAFAKTLGMENLAALTDAVKKQIGREYDQVARMRTKRLLLDQLAATADFAAPEGMVDAEFNGIWQRIEADLKEGRLDDDDKGKDEATLKADYRAIAERRVKLGLLLAEIGRANTISVAENELKRAMQAQAMRFPGQEKQVFDYFAKNPQALEGLRAPIFEEKVVDFILELASVTERKVAPEELSADPADPPAGAAPADPPAPAAPA
ncbi:MAG: trigger factor [Acetobacteraceae bacterium]|nr:trigger factor [Acetobacteraceae bacterium]